MEVEQKSQVSSVNDKMELACSDGNQQSSHLNNKLSLDEGRMSQFIKDQSDHKTKE